MNGLYNMLMTVNPLTPYLLGAIGFTRDNFKEYANLGRFRDVYTNQECTKVFILTRNYTPDIEGRSWDHVDAAVAKNPNFVRKFADQDPTYQIYEFSIPEFLVTKDVAPGTRINIHDRLRERVPQEYRTPAMDRYRALMQRIATQTLNPDEKEHIEVVMKAMAENLKNVMEGNGPQVGVVMDGRSGASVVIKNLDTNA